MNGHFLYGDGEGCFNFCKDFFKNTIQYQDFIRVNDLLFKKMKEVPYGNFNYHEENIYYKYVLVCKENTIEKEIIYDIINVLYYTIDVVIDEIIN